MMIEKIEDYAERTIVFGVTRVPDVDETRTDNRRGLRPRQVVLHYVSVNSSPWELEHVEVRGILINRNGQLSTARNAEISQSWLWRDTNHLIPHWVRGVARDHGLTEE
jgi:hypothetical protein